MRDTHHTPIGLQESGPMANRDRLTGLDSSFLHLEHDATHMHVAGCMVFDGEAPGYDELVGAHPLAPASRAPLSPAAGLRAPQSGTTGVGRRSPLQRRLPRPPHRAAAPGGEDQLKRLCGRVFSQALDRSRPLWEIWLVEGLAEDRFALLSKTHHALVDGVSGVDIATVLFDASPDPVPVAPPEREWIPRPLPTGAQLLGRSAAGARHRYRPRSSAASARRCAGRAMSPPAWAERWPAWARWPGWRRTPPRQSAQRPYRPPPPLHLGTGGPGGVQGGQERPRRDRQRRRPRRRRRSAGALPARPRAGN